MTTQAKFLIERAAYDDDNPVKMSKVVTALGMPCVQARYVPIFGGCEELKTHDAVDFSENDCVVFYGSINCCQWLQRNKKWHPLAWADFEGALRCRHYYTHWGQYLLSEEYAMMPLDEVLRRQEWVWKTFADASGHIFIRPDANDKSFAGEVVHKEKVKEWHNLANFYRPGPEALTIVARPSKLDTEWRLIIHKRKVLTGSQYRLNGLVEIAGGYPKEAADFAEVVTTSSHFEPAPLYCMDICRTADGAYKLVEIGAVNTAGLYDCDIELLVLAMAEIAVEEWTDLWS